MKVTFITGNQHKVKEAQGIFQQFDIKLEHVDLGYPEIQGKLTDVACYSSYVQSTLGNEGILKLMKNVQDRYAEFRSVVGFATPKTEPEIFLGVVGGHIVHHEKGKEGFAYDPLFKPECYDQTFGELTLEQKNEISHRRRSLERFANWYRDFTSKKD